MVLKTGLGAISLHNMQGFITHTQKYVIIFSKNVFQNKMGHNKRGHLLL